MRKIEIKKLGAKNLFKVTVYMMAIPAVLFFLVGIAMVLIGFAVDEHETVGIGAAVGIGYPIMMLIGYGLMSMLTAVIYNFFAKRFGGVISVRVT